MKKKYVLSLLVLCSFVLGFNLIRGLKKDLPLKQSDLLSAKIELDKTACDDPYYPLLMTVTNKSEHYLKSFYFDLKGYFIGKSEDIFGENFDREGFWDIIIPPNKTESACLNIPRHFRKKILTSIEKLNLFVSILEFRDKFDLKNAVLKSKNKAPIPNSVFFYDKSDDIPNFQYISFGEPAKKKTVKIKSSLDDKMTFEEVELFQRLQIAEIMGNKYVMTEDEQFIYEDAINTVRKK